MKMPKPLLIHVERVDIEESLKRLPKETSIFPYRFRFSGRGREIKKIDLICSKAKAVCLEIQYVDKAEKIKI